MPFTDRVEYDKIRRLKAKAAAKEKKRLRQETNKKYKMKIKQEKEEAAAIAAALDDGNCEPTPMKTPNGVQMYQPNRGLQGVWAQRQEDRSALTTFLANMDNTHNRILDQQDESLNQQKKAREDMNSKHSQIMSQKQQGLTMLKSLVDNDSEFAAVAM